ncbi:c-type cytochrome [Pseudomonas sp. SDO55104_S430]
MRKLHYAVAVLGLFTLEGVKADQAATLQILQRNACTACHQATVKTVGPSWQDVANRYRDGSKTAAELGESVKKGSTGQWGPVPMPPQAQLNDADLATVTQWILSSN